MLNSLHWEKINKMVFTDTWDGISDEAREIIASDTLEQSELGKWFSAHILATTNQLYKDEGWEFNNVATFSKA